MGWNEAWHSFLALHGHGSSELWKRVPLMIPFRAEEEPEGSRVRVPPNGHFEQNRGWCFLKTRSIPEKASEQEKNLN